MICQNCHKNVATVTVLEIPPGTTGAKGDEGGKPVQQQELCEICAQSKNLPHAPLEKKLLGDIWKLLQVSGTEKKPDLSCPSCGMTREEFRRKGRVGCADDYEVFAEDVQEILERVHGATAHCGRVPGVSQAEVKIRQRKAVLERQLDAAIEEEAYENAARIRDELKTLGESPTP